MPSMTIVAYYKDTLFADSMSVVPCEAHNQISFRDKLHVSPCRRIAYVKAGIVIPGELSKDIFNYLLSVFTEHANTDTLCVQADSNIYKLYLESTLVMLKNSTWRFNENTNFFHRLGSEEIYSIGTGTNVFEMSLALGTTGIKAVENAIKYSSLCGGPIVTVKRSSLKPFTIIKSKKAVA